MKRCHGCLHYDRKFQIFIFLIGHINVNKGVFCLINSYLQIKSYNVLNYNNCSTDWPFPLTDFHQSNVGSVDSIYTKYFDSISNFFFHFLIELIYIIIKKLNKRTIKKYTDWHKKIIVDMVTGNTCLLNSVTLLCPSQSQDMNFQLHILWSFLCSMN